MACDPQTIATSTKCLLALSTHQLLSAWALYLCEGGTPAEDTRITEEGDTRITEEGDTRITE